MEDLTYSLKLKLKPLYCPLSSHSNVAGFLCVPHLPACHQTVSYGSAGWARRHRVKGRRTRRWPFRRNGSAQVFILPDSLVACWFSRQQIINDTMNHSTLKIFLISVLHWVEFTYFILLPLWQYHAFTALYIYHLVCTEDMFRDSKIQCHVLSVAFLHVNVMKAFLVFRH